MMNTNPSILPILLTYTFLLAFTKTSAFSTYLYGIRRPQKSSLNAVKIGIFYGTSTGSTGDVADLIYEAFGDDVASEPIEIEEIAGDVASNFATYDALIVGTPTWNTGADTERSGTGWDEIYYGEMQECNDLVGKKVAVFGLGDSVSYGENFADASGELHDVFENLGCCMMGYTSQEGYLHSASKAIRGDLFCGLLNDAVNQEELIEERVESWVAQLIAEGILNEGAAVTPNSSPTRSKTIDSSVIEQETKSLEDNSRVFQEETIATKKKPVSVSATDGKYTPHYNANTGITMWTSSDGRLSYFTDDGPKIFSKMP